MKLFAITLAFFLGSSVFAGDYPGPGRLSGLAFESAISSHPMVIQGGELVNCKAPENRLDITRCEVKDGSISVELPGGEHFQVSLKKVNVLRNDGTTPSRHYYYFGDTGLAIGGKGILAPVRAVISVEDSAPDRYFGFIELLEQVTRTSFEAYPTKP